MYETKIKLCHVGKCETRKTSNINNTNDDEKYFPYSLIYSIIIEDLNKALKVNLSLADILFTSFLKINKITKDLKLV